MKKILVCIAALMSVSGCTLATDYFLVSSGGYRPYHRHYVAPAPVYVRPAPVYVVPARPYYSYPRYRRY